MKRRNFIKAGSLLGLAPLLLNAKKEHKFDAFSQTLLIPKLARYNIKNGIKIFDLEARKGGVEFFKGIETDTYGVNTDFLGVTIRVKSGDKVRINVKNSMDETTTLHWHGLEVPGSSDGEPHSKIVPNATWNTQMQIAQNAATIWYHPHTHGETGRQVFMGMAGLFLIDDKNSDRLDIPKEYGVDDIPLIIQDRRFYNNGEFMYKQGMHDTMMGVTGNIRLVNGIVDPVVEVEPKAVRFRILNGSNARIYNLMFEGGV